MKKASLFVYFLSLALVLPNLSIPAHASTLSEHVEAEIPEPVMEDGKEAKETRIPENSIEKDTVLEEEGGISVCETNGGTFGYSNGFRWIYDESTRTLTITGEDEMITWWEDSLPDEVRENMNKVVFQDCVAIGSMNSMFAGYSSLESVDMSGLDTSSVTDMSFMFSGCSSLESVDVSGLDTSQVTYMHGMFNGCSSLASVDISGFDASSVEHMLDFSDCSRLEYIATPKVMAEGVYIELPTIFEDSQKNVVSKITSAHCNKVLTKKIEQENIFGASEGFRWTYDESTHTLTITGEDERIDALRDSLPAGINRNMNKAVFRDCVVTDDMGRMFNDCSSLTSVDLSGVDTSQVTYMGFMFENCGSLTSVDLSGIDTSQVTNMYQMFSGCSSLENVDVSGFNTSQVKVMYEMFSGCSSLESVDLSGFDTSQVTTMYGMFSGCSSLESVDVSGFDTSGVTDMSSMFSGCSSLASVDISGFDTSSVTDMSGMFNGCGSLTTIATPQVMKKGQSIKLPTTFEDSQKNIVREITSAHCNKILTRRKGYDITYHLDGGKNHADNPVTYEESSATIKLKDPTKTGYTFKGWYSDSKFTKKVKTIPKGSEGNKTLYAKWTANEYNIAFKGNGSNSGSMKKMTDRKYGKSYTLSKNAFKRTGYTFSGWNTKADGSGTSYKNKASVKNLSSKNGSTVTLYAQWKPKTYKIVYHNLNGGTNHSKNPKSYTVTTSTIKLQKPTRKGYTFKGWYSDKGLTQKVTMIQKGSTGNKTLYAKWVKK